MLNSILAYVTFNIKALLKNKISFVWSVALPLVMFWIDKDAISSEVELIYWWVYMVLCSYIYGIGLYALELRETGSLFDTAFLLEFFLRESVDTDIVLHYQYRNI